MSDPVAQQVKHLVGALGVAHRPVQVGDPRQTPPHQLELVHPVGVERVERLLGFCGVALPQQRAGQQLAGDQPAATVHRSAGQPFAERDVGQRDRIPRRGHQQIDIGRLVAVEGQLRQPDSVRRAAQRLALQRAHHFAAQPSRRRHPQPAADDLTEQRMVEPHLDARCSSTRGSGRGSRRPRRRRRRRRRSSVSRSSGSQNVSSRSACSTLSGSWSTRLSSSDASSDVTAVRPRSCHTPRT